MSHFLDRLTFFRKYEGSFADGHGQTTHENRDWENAYRQRWSHDKIVRSTHGVNCTGSCSWKIYVKGGIVTWETQQTDYPRTRPELPNHEPRGCSRGASYSWYLYSANRLKYPMVRGALIRHWREARKTMPPVAAWQSIVENPEKRADYTSRRGLGGFVRLGWDEANEIIAASNAYTIRKYGPDRVAGFSPIPAMSMISYAAGTRYLSLLGGVCLSFYDWYCDLPPSSPQTWGEQTDVPESADWYNAGFLLLWGSNVPQTRTPDAHFYTEARYRGAKSVVITPDYSEAAKFGDLWLHPKQGTNSALAMAFGHVILKEFHVDRQTPYFTDYCRRYSDMPFLVRLVKQDGRFVPDRLLRASDFDAGLGQDNNPEWKTVAFDETSDNVVVPNGSIGFRWGEKGKWNLETKAGAAETTLSLSTLDKRDDVLSVAFPYFGGRHHDYFTGTSSRRNPDAPCARAESPSRGWRSLCRHGVRSALRQLRCRSGIGRRKRRHQLRRRCALYAGLAGSHHRREARVRDLGRPRLRPQCGEDQGQVHGHSRGRDQSLVPHGHDLSRHHQHAGDVRLRGPGRRRLVALCRSGKAAPANRLAAAGLRAGLGAAAAPHECHLLLVRPFRSVALQIAGCRRNPLAAGQQGRVERQPDRFQRARRAHGLAAVGAAACRTIRWMSPAPPRRPARIPRTMCATRSNPAA